MSFSGKSDEAVYILVAIKIHVDNDMDSCNYVYDVLDYKKGKWCNCDGYKITNYSGYLVYVYDNVSN